MSDKGESLIEKLKIGWMTVPDLLELTGWKPHTLRAAISTQARKLGLQVERSRENGITSYRVMAL